ncbi:transglutaminase domain-containing protein [Alicyclobacillus sp. TC]|uniref:Transglutaminase-like domain-containing protein n=1 Tax=Alicyclobacillus tolerans TaxID=90970 RepID=A0A1M6QZS6_9BACL|nr:MULTISPECIES: transglutaminase domain-containing protein [Alicyclobacillus]QRF22455.1 transglutaminase domain-containing protein [Alicyclobacillus sp. TC]SHK25704.1 protein of unknown function [Alicyclobacillus montanus]
MSDTKVAHVSRGVRLAMGCLAAIWLYLFLPPMAALQLLRTPASFWILLLPLAIVTLFPSRLLRAVISLLASYAYTFSYYTNHAGFTALRELLKRERKEMLWLLQQHHLVDPLATQLFLFLLAVLFWLIVYASQHRRLWILYNLLGVMVLGVIDGNTKVHPNIELVWMLLLFAIVLSLHGLRPIFAEGKMFGLWGLRLFTPMILLFVCCAGVAFALPKPKAAWPNPLQHWITSTPSGVGRSQQTPEHFVGYQLNDSRLGGPFVENDTPVLDITESFPTYIEGQVLSTYTGHGWISAGINGNEASNVKLNQVVYGGTSDALQQFQTRENIQNIQLVESLPTHVLPAGYLLKKVIQFPMQVPAFVFDHLQGNLYAPQLPVDSSYTVVSEQLVHPYQTLAQHPISLNGLNIELPDSVAEHDLQLPAELPRSVYQLTQKIIAGSANEYSAVMDVMHYLQTHYSYHTQNIPIPGPHQDYVAQFLFQSRRGYCNNFSSSMAVMLRTVGIPTRWVTGFTAGQEISSGDNGSMPTYQISESDAHSWVQVYFPGYGWVPFDPTPSYHMPFAPNVTAGLTGLGSSYAKTPASSPAMKQQNPTSTRRRAIPIPGARFPSVKASVSSQGTTFPWLALLISLVGLAALMVVIIFWGLRRRRPERTLRDWQTSDGKLSARPMVVLIRHLQRVGWLPNHRQSTLRDLVQLGERTRAGREGMLELVRTLELHWYGKQPLGRRKRERLLELWQLFYAGVDRRTKKGRRRNARTR